MFYSVARSGKINPLPFTNTSHLIYKNVTQYTHKRIFTIILGPADVDPMVPLVLFPPGEDCWSKVRQEGCASGGIAGDLYAGSSAY